MKPSPRPEFSWIGIERARDLGLDDMLALHWEEIEDHRDVSPMDVDWPRYKALERAGQLKIGALLLGGRMVGYNVFFLHAPLHSRSTLWAVNDVLWLDPEHRRGWAGVKLLKAAEQGLRKMGAKVILYSAKEAVDLAGKRQRDTAGRLLARLGYSSFDRAWSKAL
jgi:GNAT superfamily N-acetyltransferase